MYERADFRDLNTIECIDELCSDVYGKIDTSNNNQTH